MHRLSDLLPGGLPCCPLLSSRNRSPYSWGIHCSHPRTCSQPWILPVSLLAFAVGVPVWGLVLAPPGWTSGSLSLLSSKAAAGLEMGRPACSSPEGLERILLAPLTASRVRGQEVVDSRRGSPTLPSSDGGPRHGLLRAAETAKAYLVFFPYPNIPSGRSRGNSLGPLLELMA